MKSTKIVKTPAKTVKVKATTKEVTTYTCDLCLKSVDKSGDNRYGSGMSSCYLCKRDICRRKVAPNSYEMTCMVRVDNGSDYDDHYCKICAAIYLPAKRQMEERQWKEEEDLEAEMVKKSLTMTLKDIDKA